MENNSRNNYGRNSHYKKKTYYKPSNNRGGRNNGRYNNRKSTIRIDQLVSKAIYEDLPSIYEEDKNLLDFDLVKQLKENITSKKYTTPTKIQYQAIPKILEGRDILGMASTGSGKTAAFLIPMINKSIKDVSQRFLIVVPTRELAMQIQDEFRQLSRNTNLNSVLVIGGNNIRAQISILKRDPEFVIATPGRLKDVTERRVLNLSKINNVVLDEVDRMLDMGFINDIRYITSKLNPNRQSLFFSATTNRKSEEIANTLLKNPVRIEIEKQEAGKNVDQDIIKIKGGDSKFDILCEYMQQDECKKVLIFTRTKRGADKLKDSFRQGGVQAEALHGNKRQNQRSKIINSFKQDSIDILIATDVASRGLDVNNITHVINYDIPENYQDYIHRIGRTGRAGKKGFAVTFV